MDGPDLEDSGFGNYRGNVIVNAKILFRIPRKTRFLKKAGFPDLSGKNF
jgi:hypothetical protein